MMDQVLSVIGSGLIVGVPVGFFLGRASSDDRLSRIADLAQDRADDAEHRLNLARVDPYTGSSFTPRPRAAQRQGWAPAPTRRMRAIGWLTGRPHGE